MIVVCGDSISAGQYLPAGKAWPDLLGYENRSVSNDTTRLMLERFPQDVQASGADICIIQVGHNDANRWQTDGGITRVLRLAFTANLWEMVHRCHTFKIRPVFCTITPVRRLSQYQDDLRDYNASLRMVAERANIALIDVERAFMDAPDNLMLDDGLHLSEAGQEFYAAHVKVAFS